MGKWGISVKNYISVAEALKKRKLSEGETILFRLKKSMAMWHFSALKELKYLADYSTLMVLYNKTKLFDATRKMLNANRDKGFVFLYFDAQNQALCISPTQYGKG